MIAFLFQAAFYLVLPILGILLFEWDWRPVLLLYWLENITVGLGTLIAMIRTKSTLPEQSGRKISFTVNGQLLDGEDGTGSGKLAKAALSGFFVLHYGLFTAVHGIFVFLVISGLFGGGLWSAFSPGSGNSYDSASFDIPSILIVWAIASAVQLGLSLFKPAASLPPVMTLFWSPYRRIFALHLTLILGVGLIIWLGWPPIAALLLVALHFLMDLRQLRKGEAAGKLS